jgi:hypothetical protein
MFDEEKMKELRERILPKEKKYSLVIVDPFEWDVYEAGSKIYEFDDFAEIEDFVPPAGMWSIVYDRKGKVVKEWDLRGANEVKGGKWKG